MTEPSSIPPLAEQLVAEARRLLRAGNIRDAVEPLVQACELHRKGGRDRDEARCRILLATTLRLFGELDTARSNVLRAQRLAKGNDTLTTQAHLELAAIHNATGNTAAATDEFERAAEHEPDVHKRAETLSKRAQSLAASGQFLEAAGDLEEAANLFSSVGASGLQTKALVERASALQQGAHPLFASALLDARIAVTNANDKGQQGDLDLLEAAQSIATGDVSGAREQLLAARNHALQGRAPVTYIGACIALSQVEEICNDRVGAYGVIAVGWVTLADLMGREAAASVFQPQLDLLLQRWGNEEFISARTEYENNRREILANGKAT
jgi:tetratricopeptide (TPR) repeat protein